jgi:hypothetical protein
MNNLNHSRSETKEFFDRPFEEVEGGYYDGKGFYCTPEGSFWDENGAYFNREGLDKHGGFYDEYCIYIPGPGWNEEFCCYDDEMNMDIDDDIKEVINKNIYEELVEGYHYYENLYKNYDKEDVDEIDEDLINKNDSEIFEEYIKKNFGNLQGLEINNGVNENHSYNISNMKNNSNNNIHNNTENSAGKNNFQMSARKGDRLNLGNGEYNN